MSAKKNLERSLRQLLDMGVQDINEELLQAIVKRQGVANSSLDASLVSETDKREKQYVVDKFIVEKLGEAADQGAQELEAILHAMKSVGIRQKQRAAVYYKLVQTFNKENMYL